MNLLMARINEPEDITIKIGAWYIIRKPNETPESRRMRAVKKYENFVLFEDKNGTRECFTYWYLARFAA